MSNLIQVDSSLSIRPPLQRCDQKQLIHLNDCHISSSSSNSAAPHSYSRMISVQMSFSSASMASRSCLNCLTTKYVCYQTNSQIL